MVDDTKIASVIEKIKRLQALAKGNANQNELLAALKAADHLIQTHRISQAQLEAAKSVSSEAFVRKTIAFHGKRSLWMETILSALCTHYGGCFYLSHSEVEFDEATKVAFASIGKEIPDRKRSLQYTVVAKQSDAEVIEYLYQYLTGETDRLGTIHCAGMGVGYAASWRVGCSEGIASQFEQDRREAAEQARQNGQTAAMVLLTNRAKESRSAMQQMFANEGKRLGSATGIYGSRSQSGREAGRAVGRSISIRKGLKG